MAKGMEKASPYVGELIKGQGIYLGYHPICRDNGAPIRNKNGQIIYHHFFAAPEALNDKSDTLLSGDFLHAAKAIGNLEKYYGYNGEFIANNKDFIRKIENNNYGGGWRAPALDILIKMSHAGLIDNQKNEEECWYGSSSEPVGGARDFWQANLLSGKKTYFSQNTDAHWWAIRSVPKL